MKHSTRFTPQNPLGKLEALKGKRYNYAEIAGIMNSNTDRQKIRYQLNNSLGEIKMAMLDKWLDFFASEGMPIVLADLFTVTVIDTTLGPLTLAATGTVGKPNEWALFISYFSETHPWFFHW